MQRRSTRPDTKLNDTPQHRKDDEFSKDVVTSDSSILPRLWWQSLSPDALSSMTTLSAAEIHDKVAEILGMKDHQNDIKKTILVDYYFNSIWYGMTDMAMSAKQISGFYHLSKLMFENLSEHQFSLSENSAFLRSVLVAYSIHPGPSFTDDENATHAQGQVVGDDTDICVNTFSTDQTIKIATFFQQGLLQHYRLYRNLFTVKQEDESENIHMILENPLCVVFQPLAEFETLEAWNEKREAEAAALATEEAARLQRAAAAEATQRALEEAREKLTPARIQEITADTMREFMAKLETDVRTRIQDMDSSLGAAITKLEKVAGI